MSIVFFPSCQVKADYPRASARLREYLRRRLQIEPAGCCREDHQKLTPEDTALYLCNTCVAIIEESSRAGKVCSVWELIDSDPDFPFPDYGGEEMTVQDCWSAKEKRPMQEAVRSLMRKMGLVPVEQEENFEKTRFHGLLLLGPCSERNAKAAPRRYVEEGGSMFTPMSPEEQQAYLRRHCEKLPTEKVLCACKFCKAGIDLGGKQGVFLLDLLFPEP